MKNKNLISVFILWTSTFITWVLSYMYHPIMIRYLSLEEFAEFESLLSIINLLGVLVMAISLFLVKEVAKAQTKEKINALIEISIRIWLTLGSISYMFYILLTPLISNFLKIDNYMIIMISWITILLSFLWIYQKAYLQWKSFFKALSIFWVINPLLRVFTWIIMVLLWFWIFWAIGWFILSQIIIFVIGYIYIQKKITNQGWINSCDNYLKIKNDIYSDFKFQKKQIFHFFLSSIILAILMNIDILFAKHLFEWERAGTYAWISIIGKFLIFIWMSIETVYYSILVSKKTIDKKKIFQLSTLYIIMTIGALIFFYLFWEIILHIFKPWFEENINLLYLIILYCGALSLLNFIVKVLIAFNKYMLNYILIVFIIIAIFALYSFTGDSMYNLVHVLNGLIWVSLISGLVYLWLVKNNISNK